MNEERQHKLLLKPVNTGMLVRTDFVRAFVKVDREVFLKNECPPIQKLALMLRQ